MTAAGAKIIEGLKDAVAGNFSAVTIEGQRWVRSSNVHPIFAGWQTTKTAPKDGSNFLVTMAGGEDGPYWVVYWNGHDFESVDSGSLIDLKFMTHWMHLPKPPEEA